MNWGIVFGAKVGKLFSAKLFLVCFDNQVASVETRTHARTPSHTRTHTHTHTHTHTLACTRQKDKKVKTRQSFSNT